MEEFFTFFQIVQMVTNPAIHHIFNFRPGQVVRGLNLRGDPKAQLFHV